MMLVVGLGNPGQKYERTWHNAGFVALDAIQNAYDQPIVFTEEKRFNATLAECKIGRQKLILTKPQTYMNRSGIAVSAVAAYYKISPEHIVVIHDDVDLDLGRVKISKNVSAGGHNGINSIIELLGNKNFTRIRIGVCQKHTRANGTDKYVLSKIDKIGATTFNEVINQIPEILEHLVRHGVPSAMNRYN